MIDFSDIKFDVKTDFLANGGYGDVFKGTWEGAPVAIKRFGKRYLSTKKAIRDFIKEIEVLNFLRHPNIVQYLGVSLDNSTATSPSYYMLAEFVSRGSLFDLLHGSNRKSLDDAQILELAK